MFDYYVLGVKLTDDLVKDMCLPDNWRAQLAASQVQSHKTKRNNDGTYTHEFGLKSTAPPIFEIVLRGDQ